MSAAKKANLNLVWGDIPAWAEGAVAAIMESLQKVDPSTYHHCLRVGQYSKMLAKDAGLSEFQQQVAEFAGTLHDVGKIAVSPTVIHKPGKLDPLEYEQMKSHSLHSEDIIAPLGSHEFFRQVIPAVRGHHERVDGRGYPDKLHGDDIPVISRVILIVDTLDAMGETRAYRKGMPIEKIYQEIQKFAGTQFDSSLAKTFLESHRHWQKANEIDSLAKKILGKVA